MPQLMRLSNGQFILTIPRHIVRTLRAKKGDKMEFSIDIKKAKVWLEKEG